MMKTIENDPIVVAPVRDPNACVVVHAAARAATAAKVLIPRPLNLWTDYDKK